MDESQPGANPLQDGWAVMGAIYRAAWEQAARSPSDPLTAATVLTAALERMLRLTEAAEAQVRGPATAFWSAASKVEYEAVGERIEGVVARLAKLEADLSAAAWPVPTDALAETPSSSSEVSRAPRRRRRRSQAIQPSKSRPQRSTRRSRKS